ncbi:MAG: NAD(P)/FAD-dependent oxidoreductase [Propionibacteriaceae bacterium]|jgi:sulfide:quinone oxidoreductase|nr:NAD(P)/FAD-dependent oxidoreductase [Propionibacteriaceae bacterium]
MARLVILGAGVAGHTAALHARRRLGKAHEVIVVAPNAQWNWIPSNIWVGVGKMPAEKVLFPLAPVYRRQGIEFHQALATEIHPEGGDGHDHSYVVVRSTAKGAEGREEAIEYDFLINATGPKLNFAATKGLGPDGYTLSVCTAPHAAATAGELKKAIARLKAGEHLRFVVGTGHGTCTCEGAAFEYTFNLDHVLREAGVRDRAEVVYLTNEAQLGDFGVGGLTFTQQGFQTTSKLWTESLYRERGIQAILGAHCTQIEPGVVHYEQIDGSLHELPFDFAMLLPPFRGADLKAYDKAGADISDQLFNPAGFLKVDANYAAGAYENWSADDWPKTYQSPLYDNVFAAGIAFAPPHQISQPRTSPNGTLIAPAPPRTGMPSGMIAKAVVLTIVDRIRGGGAAAHEAPMTRMGAACVASAGMSFFKGSAAAMTMHPVVPDWRKYPATGRDLKGTSGEIGLAGHWMKHTLHVLFLYKAKAHPLWWLIPE